MIYEVRVCDVKPRTVPEALRRIEEAYVYRREYSEWIACWRGEIGQLNRIVQIWPYDNLAHRDEVRRALVGNPHWPPKMGDLIVNLEAELMTSLDLVPPMSAGDVGPIFDWHSYEYPTGELPEIIRCWKEALPHRLEHGPISAILVTDLGRCNRFVHIVPYRSLADYSSVRSAVAASGQWPPSLLDSKKGGRGYDLVAQESAIFSSVPFSPVR